MMALEAKLVCAHQPRRNPHLAHVVRLGRQRVAVNHVLDGARKDLAVGVAGQEGGRVGRQHDGHGPRDVAQGFGRHPRVVFFGRVVIVGGCAQGFAVAAGRGMFVVIVGGGSALALFLGLVAFEDQRLDHCGRGEDVTRVRDVVELEAVRWSAAAAAGEEPSPPGPLAVRH